MGAARDGPCCPFQAASGTRPHDRATGLPAAAAAVCRHPRPPAIRALPQARRRGRRGGHACCGVPARRCAKGAIVLAPEQPLEPSMPIVLIALLGLADGLGSLVPPVVAVTFGWPDRIEVNGGAVGGVRFACAATEAAEAVPDWLVIGFGVAMRGPRTEAGRARALPAHHAGRRGLRRGARRSICSKHSAAISSAGSIGGRSKASSRCGRPG